MLGYVVGPMGSPRSGAHSDIASADPATVAPAEQDTPTDPATATNNTPEGKPRPLDRPLTDIALVLAVGAVTLPILWMGYGTDIDVPNVLDAAETIRTGDYQPSRPPGVPVFEAVVAVLDPVGGHVLVNLATAVAAGFAVVGLARLVRTWGHANGDLLALAFLAAPITIIAATSLADFLWAVAFFVWAALAHLHNRSLLAGLLFAFAAGSRLSTVFLVAAFLVADGWDAPHRRRCLRSAAVAAPFIVLLFVPSWLAFDRSLEFLQTSDDGYRSFGNNLGRFLYKNYATAGIALIAVLLVAAPALVGALRRWNHDPMLRFAALGLVVTQALFFWVPWKPAHLLPSLLAALLWLGASRRNQRRFLWVVVAAVAIGGLVTFRPLAPDDPDDARGGRWDPSLGAGLLVNDIACRFDTMNQPPEAVDEVNWSCTLKPVRGPVAED
jgi:MFS family permease